MQATTLPVPGQETENRIDVAGFLAWDDPYRLPNPPYSRSKYELDKSSLQKLWATGLDVETLEDAHRRYKISPLRVVSDLWRMLGYTECPMNPSGQPRFNETDLTALALTYPNPQTPGELYPYTDFIRIRFAQTNNFYSKKEQKYVDAKYGQPTKFRIPTHSEPYFLCVREQWDRLYDVKLPLIITEGELKAVALGLAGVAGMAFPGVQMWRAGQKAGKHKLHPSIDPKGPREKWAIPVQGRVVALLPDGDFRSNRAVRESMEQLAKALLDAGAGEVFIIRLPAPPTANDDWKGIDDYLTAKLGQRWGGNPEKVTQAQEIVNDLIENHSIRGNRTDWNHPATAPERAALRMERTYRRPEQYTAAILGDVEEGKAHVGWLMYADDHYEQVQVYRTIGNTSGKVSVESGTLIRHSFYEWQEGIRLAREEGDIDGKVPGMPADYPNRTLAILAQRLDERGNDTLIEPFGNVRPGDKCLRIRGGLINLHRCFETGAAWDKRIEWLLPPDYRWFSSSYLAVSLSQLEKKPECPVFLDMINHAFDGDQERVRCLQLWFGKILCSPMFYGRQQFLALYGKAGGGKGTIIRILLKLLGENTVAEMRANFGGRFDTADLPGKKLIVYNETPDGATQGKFDPYMADIIKQITGDDRIVCEPKGMKSIRARVHAEVVTVGNTPPSIPMDEKAFRRRAVLIRVSNPHKKQDSAVEEAMMRYELAGILMWALEGACRLFHGEEIKTPKACDEDMNDVAASVAMEEKFITSQIVQKEKSFLSTERIADAYRMWLLEQHVRVPEISKKKLGFLIREHFGVQSEPKTTGGKTERVYHGLAFVNAAY